MKRNRVVYYTAILGWLYIIVEYALRVSDSVIVDHLMADFGVAAAGIGVLSSAYYIPYVFMQFPAGILIDRFGLKLSWTHGIFLVTLGSYLFAKSTSLEVATLARILMGIGSAFALIGTIKLIHANFSHKYHAFFHRHHNDNLCLRRCKWTNRLGACNKLGRKLAHPLRRRCSIWRTNNCRPAILFTWKKPFAPRERKAIREIIETNIADCKSLIKK